MTDVEIKAVIAKYLKIRVRQHKDVIKATGIPASSYYRKMSNPAELRVEEIRKIFDYLKIPKEERIF